MSRPCRCRTDVRSIARQNKAALGPGEQELLRADPGHRRVQPGVFVPQQAGDDFSLGLAPAPDPAFLPYATAWSGTQSRVGAPARRADHGKALAIVSGNRKQPTPSNNHEPEREMNRFALSQEPNEHDEHTC